mmetsp:Transcript_21613/g.74377  ORF Transcript_21613/g.74377 Transcript_21613/m.74377 type:complete len:214 (+) Transcript_21613:354-995(+)
MLDVRAAFQLSAKEASLPLLRPSILPRLRILPRRRRLGFRPGHGAGVPPVPRPTRPTASASQTAQTETRARAAPSAPRNRAGRRGRGRSGQRRAATTAIRDGGAARRRRGAAQLCGSAAAKERGSYRPHCRRHRRQRRGPRRGRAAPRFAPRARGGSFSKVGAQTFVRRLCLQGDRSSQVVGHCAPPCRPSGFERGPKRARRRRHGHPAVREN